ncbi:MAG TPA: hypothetical protein VJJ23_02145 [Candidatus Nanoarchaeia archaeon]|nr:hypothetical protein [Candidatus Nanoarchaeia archaeon]
MKKKGVELSLQTIVVFIILIIVLILVILFFTGNFSKLSNAFSNLLGGATDVANK